MKFSRLAQEIETSPIITLAAEINEKIGRGETFYNLTIGDFNPGVFPIPVELKEEIINAYNAGHTNYPGAVGLLNLRTAVSHFLQRFGGLSYSPEDILIASGGRPLIYAAYQTVVDPGDKVLFPVPSWNNNYYTHLSYGIPVVLETTAENYFMPTAADIEPHLNGTVLLALCSPLNPTGTVFDQTGLEEICELVLAENRRRSAAEKPLYVLFDQIYWLLTYGDTRHHTPVTVSPEMRDYTIFIDGLSKAYASTGVRVGWGFAPKDVLAKMRTIIAHMGAWAPKAEQVAAGNYLSRTEQVEAYLNHFRQEIHRRLQGFYNGLVALKEKGYRVDVIEPRAAMYLTVKFDLVGATTPSGKMLDTNRAVHRYILDEARVGLVPFSYFGASEDSAWYRLSVGTCRLDEVEKVLANLEAALQKLS